MIELVLLLISAVIMAITISIGLTFLLGGSSHPIVAVTTGSMLPIYNGFQDNDGTDIYPFRGDILLVKKVPIESIEVGDVIVFNTTKVSDPVVHRVVAKWQHDGEYFFKTNGDNNLLPDTWEDQEGSISGDKVYGVVVFRIPHIGWFLLVVQTTIGKILILALAVLILFVGDDSNEETQANIEEQNVSHKKDSSIFLKLFTIGKSISRKKSYTYSVLALLIIILFLGNTILSSFLSPPSIRLYRLEDESRTANLIMAPSPLTIGSKWEDNFNQTTFFFPIQIEIQSGGIFNNIDHIEIRVNETKGLYRWTTVYNFIGTRVFKGAIIAMMNENTVSFASVSVELFSRGLLASPPQTFNFSIELIS